MPGTILSYHTGLQAEVNLALISQRALTAADAQAVAQAAAVLLPQVCRPDLYGLVQAHGRPHFPRPAVHLSLDGKLGNRRLFARLGLPHPDTLEFSGLEEAAAAWEAGQPAVTALGAPLVAKGAGDGMGRNVFLAKNPGELRGLAGRLETACLRGPSGLVLQRYIPGAAEMRVVLLHQDAQAYWRWPAPGQFRANLSQGGGWSKEGPAEQLAAGLALARRLQAAAGIDLAGLDLIFPPGQGPLLLEINFFFGRRGLGGSQGFLPRYLSAVRAWLAGLGLDPRRVSLAEDDL
ncbi:MAG: hypothetical protein AB1814_04500 [Thermodesulfobacteriota bacterium]